MHSKVWGFSREVFSSVFHSAFKRWKTAYLCFLGSYFVISEPNHFLSIFGQKYFSNFLKTAKDVSRNAICYLFPKKKIFVMSVLWEKILQMIFFFIIRSWRTFWYFFPQYITFCSRNVRAKFSGATKNISRVLMKVHLGCSGEGFNCFLFFKKLSTLSDS